MISKKELIDTHNRIKHVIHATPILTSTTLNELTECELFFKCENFQKVGAFKFRGASNAVLQLSPKELENGVVTHSSGNHAQALALAAKMAQAKCFVVMPSNSPKVKIDAVKGYGAKVTLCPSTQKDREEFTRNIISKTGAIFIHPYNDERIIAGQSTCAKELIETIPDLDIIIAPVGGGGLLSGTILSAQYFSPKTLVYAAEPQGADDAYRSLISGKRILSHTPNSIADGLLTTLGDKTWPIIKNGIEKIIVVSDQEIKHALQLILERMKIIVEPSSATVLAAVMKNKKEFSGKKIGLIISGGNYQIKI